MTYVTTITGTRKSGKTTKLIKLAEKEWYYIVCASLLRAAQVADLATQLGADMPYPITMDDYIRGRFVGNNIKGFLIDDVDDFMRCLARGVPVVAWTYTTGESDD